MNRKDLVYIAIILAILAIAFFYGKHEGKEKARLEQDNRYLKEQVGELSTARDVALSRAKVESEQRTKFVMASDSEQAALKAQISTLKKRISKYTSVAIVQPAQIAIDTATIINPCITQDSVINLQDHLIVSIEAEQTAVNDSFNRQIAALDSAMITEKAISETWRQGNQESTKKLRRETRRKKFWRSVATVGAVAVGVLLIGR